MQKYTDKYFLRANEILREDSLNPWVNMQVFVRRGPAKVAGINEALEIILDNSNIEKAGGRIYAMNEGQEYNPKDTVMNIIAPVQEIMELETIYLGVIAAATTKLNDQNDLDLKKIGKQMRKVVDLAGKRPVLYFGARHWHYNMDKELAKLAYANGITSCATDNGAEVAGQKGVGTIPHALENIYAYKAMKAAQCNRSKVKLFDEEAVLQRCLNWGVYGSIVAFDKYMDPEIPRIALIDYANKEIDDTTLATLAISSGNGLSESTRLNAVRVDTCGENVMQGGIPKKGKKYWSGKGVTVNGVYALRKDMDEVQEMNDSNRVGIILSSGFSNPEKVKAFNEGEKFYRTKLYDGIGAGFLDGVRTSTADIVAVGESPDEVDFYTNEVQQRNIIHKVGRPPRPNYDLERIL